MKALTRDDIQHLTQEQQKAVATVVVSGLNKRQKLLECARGYRGRSFMATVVAPVVLLALGAGASIYFNLTFGFFFLLGCAMVIAVALFGYHMFCTNRRIDALLELLDVDKQGNCISRQRDDATETD